MAIGSPQWMYASGEDFTIDQSLRFNNPDDPLLTRTPAGVGNLNTWTFSCWFKPSLAVTECYIFRHDDGGGEGYSDYVRYSSQSGGTMKWNLADAANTGVEGALVPNALFRDASAWYHMVFALDTTLASATDRMRWYVNGEEITDFSTDTNPAQDYDTHHINRAIPHYIGGRAPSGQKFDGYLAEVHFIDGLQLTPTSFGETGDYGEWKPKQVSGLTYGTNGYYLSFAGGGIISATGGTITTDGDYKVHSFTASGTFTPSADGYVEYLVIGGGGAGAADGATTRGNGAGGAGGYRTGYLAVTAQAYSITVGAGGVGTTSSNQVNGGDSVFSSITSAGGGGGGYFTSTPGAAGGSGGGGSPPSAAGGAASPAGQGYAGEAGTTNLGGGGGGASEAGGTDGAGQGGDGLASSITGASVTRAGGGGGSQDSGGAKAGGDGGGGAGGNGGAGGDGTANTGSGGGGGVSGGSAGDGGSGIVILRYKFQ